MLLSLTTLVLTMHIYTGLKGTSLSLLAPVHTWQTVPHTLLQAQVTSTDAITYTFLMKTSTEHLKTYRHQNGGFGTKGMFVLGIDSHTQVQSSIKKCRFLLLYIMKAAATYYSAICSPQSPLWQPTDTPPVFSLSLQVCCLHTFENMILYFPDCF